MDSETNKERMLLHQKILKLLAGDGLGFPPEANGWRETAEHVVAKLSPWEQRCLALALLTDSGLRPEHQEDVLLAVYEAIEDDVEDGGGDNDVLQACCEYVQKHDHLHYRSKLVAMYRALHEQGLDIGLFLDALDDIGIDPEAEETPADGDEAPIPTGAENESN